ncbi:hypothetical protein EPUS_06284 [Endocarpon pusillum Z07020]|uniref:Rhodopsin domain-containing protein n=1 Tax=Endocarpon pusillum (strain Z07020 / HMAS-L-300199) TaxID=1263415 RepID=U1GY52_ENDPU|nr:uncharacterized protein EPUS_06284 [Endocarpon pusillum Z07020]ERF77066.1 hypothetical protein EPUS_06284 [Endocarpon pusillum Z07020]
MAIYLVLGLQTWRSKKAVVGAFASRLPMIVIIAFRLATFDEAGFTTHPTLLEDLFVVWTQAELNYSTISATIPSLRPFMNNLNTQFGGLGQTSNQDDYGFGETGSYQMSNLQSGTTWNVKHISAPTFDGNGDAYGCDAWVAVEVINNRDGKERDTTRRTSGDETNYDSSDSDRMVIKTDTTFLVAHGD